MTKKVLLAVFLLMLLVAISYIKTTRATKKSQSLYELGKKENKNEISEYKSKVDSLNLAIGQREVEYADSLIRKDISYQSKIDSLEKIIQKQKQKSKSGDNVLSSDMQKEESNKISGIPDSLRRKIIVYYKKRYNDLPKDLSSYEKKIALNEIREETASKFVISLEELKIIRKIYNLNY